MWTEKISTLWKERLAANGLFFTRNNIGKFYDSHVTTVYADARWVMGYL